MLDLKKKGRNLNFTFAGAENENSSQKKFTMALYFFCSNII